MTWAESETAGPLGVGIHTGLPVLWAEKLPSGTFHRPGTVQSFCRSGHSVWFAQTPPFCNRPPAPRIVPLEEVALRLRGPVGRAAGETALLGLLYGRRGYRPLGNHRHRSWAMKPLRGVSRAPFWSLGRWWFLDPREAQVHEVEEGYNAELRVRIELVPGLTDHPEGSRALRHVLFHVAARVENPR